MGFHPISHIKRAFYMLVFFVVACSTTQSEEFILEDIDLSTFDETLELPNSSILTSDFLTMIGSKTPYLDFEGYNNHTEVVKSGNTTDFAYEEMEAAEAVKYAAAAYCVKYYNTTKSCLNSWSCYASKGTNPLIHVKPFHYQATNTAGYVGYAPTTNRIVVSFAGTDSFSLKNWITNLSFRTVLFPHCTGCAVHLGFFNTYLGVRSQVLELVAMFQRLYPSAKLFITGHSLGGALASHMIVDLLINPLTVFEHKSKLYVSSNNPFYENGSYNPFNDLSVELQRSLKVTSYPLKVSVLGPQYTFGAPRIGNLAFGKYFQSIVGRNSVKRLTHNRDPVPHLPTLSMGFVHPTQEIFYAKGGGSYAVCSEIDGEDETCSNQYIFTLNVDDHFLYAGHEIISTISACI